MLQDLRKDYQFSSLEMADTDENPIDQFRKWFAEAQDADILEPNAMTLATATKDGIPSARIVLLKGIDQGHFLFYTNYGSQKSGELTENPHAALVFLWLKLQRQVRISGRIEKLTKASSEAYFQSRPKSSQIGAWASPQSQVIPDRSVLEDRVAALQDEYADQDRLPLPDNWGGFRLMPDTIEFWQGRSSRLHDRIQYSKAESGEWRRVRLAP